MTDKIANQAMLNRIKGVGEKATSGSVQPSVRNNQGKSFEDVLQGIKEKSVVISKHATERLASRSVSISEAELKRIGEAMDKASLKGVRDAVIILEDKILVANVPNKTIVTAAKKDDLNEQIITNINGAIVL